MPILIQNLIQEKIIQKHLNLYIKLKVQQVLISMTRVIASFPPSFLIL